MTRAWAVAVMGPALAGALLGCARGRPLVIGAGSPVPETRDELLVAAGDAVWRGDLATANAALTRLADRERGAADSALDFWSELLALLRCDPIERTPRTDIATSSLQDPWDGLRRLVQIERVRLARRTGAEPGSEAVRPAKGSVTQREVRWPMEGERWNDELPEPITVDRCPDAAAAAKAGEPEGSRPTAPEALLVVGAADGLPVEHPATAVLLVQAAALQVARGHGPSAVAPLARLSTLAPGVLTSRERNVANLAAALAAIADPASSADEVLARGGAGLAAELDAPERRSLTLLIAERLLKDKRAEDAAAVLGTPPHGDDEIGRFIAYRQVQTHAQAGRRAELLAEAREVLQGQGREAVAEDPTLEAIQDIAMRTLLSSPISDQTLELLETLGPPRERMARAENFARLAAEGGVHRSAMATYLWLYETETEPSRRLQHLARASVAAARAGDHAEFARTFRLLAGQFEEEPDARLAGQKPADARAPDKKAADKRPADRKRGDKRADAARPVRGGLVASPEADRKHETRRAARSANWQRALLVVARDALPALVASDDQANLDTLVQTLKRNLGDGGRGPVDEELTTLYRAASAHLKSGPRAYAQNLGAERRPILLGDVTVGRQSEVDPPVIDLRAMVGETDALVFVPRRGNDPALAALERWPASFGRAWTGRTP